MFILFIVLKYLVVFFLNGKWFVSGIGILFIFCRRNDWVFGVFFLIIDFVFGMCYFYLCKINVIEIDIKY